MKPEERLSYRAELAMIRVRSDEAKERWKDHVNRGSPSQLIDQYYQQMMDIQTRGRIVKCLLKEAGHA